MSFSISSEQKHLNLILDEKLSFKDYMTHLVAKVD